VILHASVDGRSLRVEVRGRQGRYSVVVDGRPMEVDLEETGRSFVSLLVDGKSHEAGLEKVPGGYKVSLAEAVFHVELSDPRQGFEVGARKAASGPARILAPMPGKLVRVLVEPGQAVEVAQGIVVIEAMKMENELHSPRAGRVKQVHVREGQAVEAGALLVVVE
jgi:biotin carboxyl carrier protein